MPCRVECTRLTGAKPNGLNLSWLASDFFFCKIIFSLVKLIFFFVLVFIRHLPHLANNVPDVEIAAIIDPSPNPVSTLSSSPLLSLTDLSKKYKCPFFTSIEELLADPEIGPTIDGAIVATSHASHFDVGMALLKEGIHRRRMAEAIAKEEEGSNKVGGNKRRKMLENIGCGDGSGTPQYPPPRQPKILHRALHILMEKPMTTSVEEARRLWEMSAKRYPQGKWLLTTNLVLTERHIQKDIQKQLLSLI